VTLALALVVLAPAAPALAAPALAAGTSGVLVGRPLPAASTLIEPTFPRATTLTPKAFTTAMTTALTATATTSRYLGPALSGLVIDPADGSVVWRQNDTHTRMPASTQKLLTTYTVLGSMTPQSTLVTATCQSRQTPSAIYVRGGGDPSLTLTRIQDLATQTADQLKRTDQTKVSLYLDGSLFPAPTTATGWPASYLRSDVQYVRGLTVAGYRGADGGLAAGKALATDLTEQGITATVDGVAVTPKSCSDLATTRSAPVSRLISDMLAYSNNDYAEYLLRQAALARGFTPSWRGAVDNEIQLLAKAGVPTAGLRVYDGSGLSRSDRMPVATLAAVVGLLREDPVDAQIVFAYGALPSAGQTGTLSKRFATSYQACARGHVQAKTGTLADAVALAGVAQAADGRDRVFVFLDSGGRQTAAVGSAIDTLATMVVGCHFG
jgi:D-alanyl-D-alanine carboxypeptidase/D-alanyl-D-alanine-endopeptidase (penicillin-binding protein 4)